MAGTEGTHGGSHDLLRQATQAMMSRYVQGYAFAPGVTSCLLHFYILPPKTPRSCECSLSIMVNDIIHSCSRNSVFFRFAHAPNFSSRFSTVVHIPGPYRNRKCPISRKVYSSTQLFGAQLHSFPLSFSSENFSSHFFSPKHTMALADYNNPNSRTNEDDGIDHIDSDTPRSGVATPRPDPSDKRLPGIMHSYFHQVGSGSSTSPTSGPLETPAMGSEAETPFPFHRRETPTVGLLLLEASDSRNDSGCAYGDDVEPSLLLPHEQSETSQISSAQPRGLHPYPTPPVSKPPSLQKLKLNDSSSEFEGVDKRRGSVPSTSFAHRKTISDSFPSKARRASMLYPLSAVLTASNVHVTQFSTPPDHFPATTPTSPARSRNTSFTDRSFSYDRLKNLKLTDDAGFPRKKSHPPTPTRALSNQTANSDVSSGSDTATTRPAPTSALTADATAASTSNGAGGAPVKFPRGKLTIKIVEAKGLRRCKDPYVVAVFQRNELVSRGPRSDYEEEDEEMKSPVGGIPMSRNGSESGRPMAIPMKSRQSSSTSLTDFRDFKMKGRKSMTNPKWDTEAVL
jgi:serine/threonine protein kinase SCH9